MFKINLKRAERKVLPAGDYVVNVVVSELRESQADLDKVEAGDLSEDEVSQVLHLEFLPDKEIHPEFEGARLFDNRSLKEGSWFRIVELMEAVTGSGLEAENEEGDLDIDEDELVGKRVGVSVIVDEEYDPKSPRNRIEGYFYPEEASPEES